MDPSGLRLECQTLENLIRFAYLQFSSGKEARRTGTEKPVLMRLLNQAFDGSPAWVMSDRYTINAKSEVGRTAATMQGPMLQALLEDRFNLRIHRGVKEVPVYALVKGQGGPKLESSTKENCTPVDLTNGPPNLSGPGQPPCGFLVPDGKGGFEMLGQTLARLCFQLSVLLDRDVVDRTGIEGTFDIHFDPASAGPPPSVHQDGAPGVSNPAVPAPRSDAFDVVVRSLENVGLRLEPAQAAGEFLVIDHVERPEAN